MRISRYAEAEGGEIELEAGECFFRYRVQIVNPFCNRNVPDLERNVPTVELNNR